MQSYILLVQASTPWYSSLQEKEGKVIQSLDIGLRRVPKVEIVLIKSLRKLQASLYYFPSFSLSTMVSDFPVSSFSNLKE